MRRVRRINTAPEMVIRRFLFRLGYRYRLHVANLPGSPDLVFPGRRAVIFVNGCFWHRHDCKRGRLPASNVDFWRVKLDKNAERDRRVICELETAGWRVLTVWECEIGAIEALGHRLVDFLGG